MVMCFLEMVCFSAELGLMSKKKKNFAEKINSNAGNILLNSGFGCFLVQAVDIVGVCIIKNVNTREGQKPIHDNFFSEKNSKFKYS